MFRRNYLPKTKLYKDADTGKWFASDQSDTLFTYSLCKSEEGFEISPLKGPHLFDSMGECLEALYQIACKAHLRDLKQSLTKRSEVYL